MTRAPLLFTLAWLVLAACAAGPRRATTVASSSIRIEAAAEDDDLAARLTGYAQGGAERVESFFGAPFPGPVRVRVFPGRSAMDAYMREAWGMDETACWMVGGAEENGLILLSPRVWREEACEHDPQDETHVRDLVAHELVHVYHMQRSPSDAFDGVEGLDWFVEGLATYASGQYERFHVARAREAVATGAAPERLAEAWTGSYRYGVSGSLVAYLESRIGRAGLTRLLEATRLEEVLTAVGMSEPELLAAWAEWVRSTAER